MARHNPRWLLALTVLVCTALTTFGARVHWGLGAEPQLTPVLAWLVILAMLVALVTAAGGSPRWFGLLNAVGSTGAYLAAGHPSYFREAGLAVGESISWVLLALALLFAGAFAYAATTRVAEIALRPDVTFAQQRALQATSALLLAYGVGEYVLTRAFATTYALAYLSDAPQHIPPLPAATAMGHVAVGVSLMAAAVLALTTFRLASSNR